MTPPVEVQRAMQPSRIMAVTLEHLRTIRAGGVVAEASKWAQRGASRSAGDVTIIPVMGTLTLRDHWYGSTIEGIRAAYRNALGDGSRAIVFEFDTPGGEVFGLEELAAEIRAGNATKPSVAMVHPYCCSAGYYLGAQASEVVVTPSGELGSVGVWAMHVDLSRALDAEGITVTLISAGEGKTDGNMFEPLSEEARADIQADIDRYYGMFVGAVAKGRGVSAAKVKGSWKAKVYGAADAVDLGLADAVGTLEDAVKRATKLGKVKASTMHAIDTEVAARQRQRARGI
jgi:signal peptide peptidase SppA